MLPLNKNKHHMHSLTDKDQNKVTLSHTHKRAEGERCDADTYE